MKLIKSLLLIAAVACTASGRAQTYPSKPVTMIIPFPAGGRTDVIGRIFAQSLQEALGKPGRGDQQTGASSVLGSNEVSEAAPDGYTIGFFSTAAVTAQYTVPTPLSLKSFDLVAIVNADPAALAVAENAPWKTLRDLVSDAKSKPGALHLGMIPGASSQIFSAGFTSAAGVNMVGVPFKGDTDGAIALAGHNIDVHFAVPVSYKSLVESRKGAHSGRLQRTRPPRSTETFPTFKENGVDLNGRRIPWHLRADGHA